MKRVVLAACALLLYASLQLHASYLFDHTSGLAEYITVGTNPMPQAAGSIQVWIFPNTSLASGSRHVLFDVRDALANNIFGVEMLAGTWTVGWKSASTDYRISSTGCTPTTSAWSNIVITWDDVLNETKLYVNGTQCGSTGSTLVTFDSTTMAKRIGNTAEDGGPAQNDNLAEVAIWTSVLSAGNISSLSAGGCANDYATANRSHYWPLLTDMSDSWGSEPGTATGATNTSGVHPTITCGVVPRPKNFLLGVFGA